MRRNSKTDTRKHKSKDLARRMYALRQIDRFIKWTTERRGYLLWRDLKDQYKKYDLPF